MVSRQGLVPASDEEDIHLMGEGLSDREVVVLTIVVILKILTFLPFLGMIFSRSLPVAVPAFKNLLKQGCKAVAVRQNQGSAVGNHLIGIPGAEELDTVHFYSAAGEQICVTDGECDLAADGVHAFPAADQRA